MGMLDSFLKPVNNGATFTLAATTASDEEAPPGARFTISSDQPTTVTFATGGAVPTTPSATVGFWLPANMVAILEAGTGDSRITGMKFFNTSGTTANICLTAWGG